ncbi:baseplate assembly protein [Salinisphaera sp. USBA-960]|nr:baseplate assembly protein [Salifodinibacter halophilus]NNC25303.1 baseplate assembly protein [Salifodinibacter halophilus]
MASVIDLSKFPPPAVIDEFDYESILAEMRSDLLSRDPDLSLYESSPASKILEVAAYREMIRRQRANERIRSLLTAYASGSDLDHIGVTYYSTQRQVINPGDPDASPPVAPTKESDEDYLRRLLLAHDSWSTAGPRAAYRYYALSADGDVKDAYPISPAPTEVTVPVLSRHGDGTANQALLDTVEAALSAEKTRPQTDLVTVQSAAIQTYQIVASLEIAHGPSPQVVRDTAEHQVRQFAETHHMLGVSVVRDAALAELYVDGVTRVHLDLSTDIVCDETEAPYCTSIEVTVA